MFNLRSIINCLGYRISLWLVLGIIASCVLSLTEYGLASSLQVLFKLLGFQEIGEVASDNWLSAIAPNGLQLVFVLTGIGLLRGFSQFWVFQSTDFIKESINTRLRLFSIHEILKDKSQKFVSATDTNVRVGEVFPKAAMFCWFGNAVIAFTIQSLVLLAAMAYVAWKETVLSMAGILCIAAIVLYLNRKVRAIASKIPQEQQGLVNGIERVSRNWLLVKIFRTQDQEYELLLSKSLEYYKHSLKAKTLGNIGSTIPLILGLFLILAIIWVNLNLWQTSSVQIITYLFLFSRFVSTSGRLGKTFGMMNAHFPYFKAAVLYTTKFDLADAKTTTTRMNQVNLLGQHISSQTRKLINEGRGLLQSNQLQCKELNAKYISTSLEKNTPPSINFNNISFSYTPDKNYLFQQVSFLIKPGQQFGVTGRSGSGKSTVLALILGLIEPLGGEVSIGGMKPQKFFDHTSSKSSIGYVGPSPLLIEGTLKDNLDYGALRSYSEDEYLDALKFSKLLDFVESIPEGLGYWINENAEGLSDGQKQRLALARAILRKPQILILDEASSNLDDLTEAEIASSLNELKGLCTTIIVTHRPGILTFADEVLDLSKQVHSDT